jgi:diguanylate cyclase (GGDEF)-like protein/PAS domain S-box-containing protein
LAILIVVHLVRPDGWVGEACYLTTTVTAAVVAWCSLFATRTDRVPRALLAACITASALGDVIWQWLVAVRHAEPDVSIADVPWLACYVFAGLALLVVARRRSSERRGDLDGLIDAGIVGVVGFLVTWHFWVQPTLADGSTPFVVRAVWAAYPICDAALLTIVARSLTSRSGERRSLLPAIGGLAAWLVSDVGFLALGSATSLGRYLDAGWMAGAGLLALGCWRIDATSDRAAAGAPDDGVLRGGRWRLALTVAPLAVPPLVEVSSHVHGGRVDPVPQLAATAVLIALVYVRARRLLDAGRDAQARLASSERLYRALAANSSDAMLLVGADGRVRNDAPELTRFLGFGERSTVGFDVFAHADADPEITRTIFDRAIVAPGVVIEDEFRMTRTDGTVVWLGARVVNLLDDPDVEGLVINLHDITDRKLAQDELAHQAFHDALTGLANRALFRDRVTHALERRVRTGADPAVLFVDLDGFKAVNDALGHEAGDELLRTIASRLSGAVRTGDTVARFGGDEFAVLIEQSALPLEEARLVAARVLEAISGPVEVEGREVAVSGSVGIAVADADSDPTTLLRDADLAMYHAKAEGRGHAVEYTSAMRDAAMRRLRIETDLHRALEAGQMSVAYQPVMELESGRLSGFEALCRWHHPTLGDIPPDQFIPIAEETGLILDLGRWVLRTACHQAAAWQAQTPDGARLSMAVNLSGRQLADPALVGDIMDALGSAGLDPGALVLEMTESVLIDDPGIAGMRLRELRRIGVRLAIDDFGTGYSSLSYLRQFPVDILKIDQSFVRAIDDHGNVPAILRGLLDLGRTLQLEMVAEGVESSVQLEQLREQHCDLGQGYLFARPLDPGAVDALVLGTASSGSVAAV